MKILIVHNIFWSHYKAAVFTELYKKCKEEGVCLEVVHVAKTQQARQFLSGVDEKLHAYPHKILFGEPLERINLFRRIVALVRILASCKPDVLMVSGYQDAAFLLSAYIAKIHGAKIVMMSDTTCVDRPRKPAIEFVKAILLKPFDLFFCYGERAREYLTSLGIKRNKVKIRVQATQNEAIRDMYLKSKDCLREKFCKRNFIYVGRFSPEKNLKTLIKVFDSIKTDKWGLILVGDGPEKKDLISLSDELQSKNIFFVGSKSWRDVIPYYASADALVLPSLSEPWGLVVNEAMLCELPVIVSDRCGCVPELVREESNGWIWKPQDTLEMKDILKDIIEGKYDLSSMGKESFKIARSFSPQLSADQILQGIKSLFFREYV